MGRVKVYKITNTVNSKVYIGWTGRKLQARFASHKSYVRQKPDYPLYAAMNQYGKDKFDIGLIEEVESTLANGFREPDEREQHWIDYYDSAYPNGYNADYGSMKRLR